MSSSEGAKLGQLLYYRSRKPLAAVITGRIRPSARHWSGVSVLSEAFPVVKNCHFDPAGRFANNLQTRSSPASSRRGSARKAGRYWTSACTMQKTLPEVMARWSSRSVHPRSRMNSAAVKRGPNCLVNMPSSVSWVRAVYFQILSSSFLFVFWIRISPISSSSSATSINITSSRHWYFQSTNVRC